MNFIFASTVFATGLFVGMLVLLKIGRRLGARRLKQAGEGGRGGLTAVEGAVFALLGLLIAFTFSGASSRFDSRRQLIVQEANNIGTAYLRLDLLSTNDQPPMRDLFRRYVDSRLSVYRKLPDVAAAKAELAESARLQQEIWKEAIAASGRAGSPSVVMLIAPALNQMFDITTTRTMAAQLHPPPIIFVMLGGVALAAALLAGHAMAEAKQNRLHIVAFAAIIALTVFVILDVEYPRFGFIRIDAFDRVLEDLRQSMN